MSDINNFRGLTQEEAKRILRKDGFNELSAKDKHNEFKIILKVLKEPMLLLLIAAGVIYLFLGSLRDALMLLFCVFTVIATTLYQEIKTEKTLKALRDLSSPRALVIRDGKQIMIAGREVVVGDLIFINEGDRVPADSLILSSENLSADESLLTGESIPVRKIAGTESLTFSRPGGDDLPFAYSGSLVTSGRGILRAIYTGANTEIGRIGKSLTNIKEEDTLLHRETNDIVRKVGVISLFLCGLIILFFVFVRHDIIGGLLSGLTLGMAILPEEFPIVLSVFLALGAWRISRRHVLTRRSAAIETLGAATVLCSDKTGTLTFNKLELSCLYTDGISYNLSDLVKASLPEEFMSLIEYGVLASQADSFDPLEKELAAEGARYLDDNHNNHDKLTLLKEYPLTKKLLMLTRVWQTPHGGLSIAAKGAPETIVNSCQLIDSQKTEILEMVKKMSDRGLRVIGVARANFAGETLPVNQSDFKFEFAGLLGFIDQIRPTVKTAIAEAQEAGIKVVMITGDYPGTAQFIARRIGLENPENYLTGSDLEKLDPTELQEKIKTTNIFARVFPEQKLLIVNAFKANGEIVAMTGDGVNDAPALKAAHIGVAMGQRGTDVAREASALILLDDDFSSIVAAVRLGRRIYDNLKRSMGYLLAVHIPIAIMSILPVFLGWPIMLLPAHIAFLELIIDPACSVIFEAEAEGKNIMKRPPRRVRQPMFSFKTVMVSLAQGGSALIAVWLMYLLAFKTGRPESVIRSFVFVSLVLSNLMLIVVNLSWDQSLRKILGSANKTMFFVSGGAILCLLAILYVPFIASLFHLAPLSFYDLLIIIITTAASLLWFELLKLFRPNYLAKI